jgi:hypothetical protein
MYFGRGDLDLDRLVACLVGLDLGTRGGLLQGFREYLILRLGQEPSLWWPGLAITVTVPSAAPWPDTEDDQRAAVDGLFNLLDEFLAEFPEGRGRGRLFHEYFLWKQQRSSLDLDPEQFRSSPPPQLISVEEAAAVLGTTQAALFDLVTAGKLEVFRAGAALLVHSSRVTEVREQQNDAQNDA